LVKLAEEEKGKTDSHQKQFSFGLHRNLISLFFWK